MVTRDYALEVGGGHGTGHFQTEGVVCVFRGLLAEAIREYLDFSFVHHVDVVVSLASLVDVLAQRAVLDLDVSQQTEHRLRWPILKQGHRRYELEVCSLLQHDPVGYRCLEAQLR